MEEDIIIAERVVNRVSKTKTIDPTTHIEYMGSVPFCIVTHDRNLRQVTERVQKYLGKADTVGKWRETKPHTWEINLKV
jgi:hypothetical protein